MNAVARHVAPGMLGLIAAAVAGCSDPAPVEPGPDAAALDVVEGGVHSYFGDYGEQRGDGQPGISRAEAQEQIHTAMLDFLNGLPTAAP